jgi:hypothetical protein
MAHWAEFEAAEPDLAARVKAVLMARKHHTLATLRMDGSPRVSGIEVAFDGDDLVLGMMPDSRKLSDVRRDGRMALHALSDDPPDGNHAAWKGDVKVGGTLVERSAEPRSQAAGVRQWLDIGEIVLTHLDHLATHLEIESWHPGRGREITERE